jgi:hypothetical protein
MKSLFFQKMQFHSLLKRFGGTHQEEIEDGIQKTGYSETKKKDEQLSLL